MKSIISHPERGPYGKSSYRGNTSGYVIKDLIEHFDPSLFVDVTEGGGTAKDVCQSLGISYRGFDLHSGFDVTRDSILNSVGTPADIVFSHPPYWNLIPYQKERQKHGLNIGSGNDLSACSSAEEFIELSQLMLLNQREASRSNGGVYTTLIGDMRKDGAFYSFQSDYIKLMPKNELKSVVIKVQHNYSSINKVYPGRFIPIVHEYLIIWQRSTQTIVRVIWDKAAELKGNVVSTWRNFVRMALINSGGKATLAEIYHQVEQIAGDRVRKNKHYQEKIRQTLQQHFEPVSRGVWKLATA